jgi:hypothetical protein
MPTINAYTQAGDGQSANEDWYCATEDLVIVLDGATIRTGTGCIHGLPWYVRNLGAAIMSGAQDYDRAGVGRDLRWVLAEAIGAVAAMHSDTCDLTHPGTPSAAAGIVRIGIDAAEWLVLGDITVLLDTPDGLIEVVDDRVSQTAYTERRECDQYAIGTPEKMAAILKMKAIELASRNTKGGYWIAATDPDAVLHAHTGSIPRDRVRRFAVCSDGVMRAVTLTPVTSAGVMATMRGAGPRTVVDQVRQVERNDPVGQRWPRNKATDDATAVYVDMGVPPEARWISEGARQALIGSITDTTRGLFGAVPTVTGKLL